MSRSVAIVTDSTSDLTREVAQAHSITVVPLNVHFGQESFRDGVDLTPDSFIARMASASSLPTTSQPAVGVFEDAFRELAQSHEAIVCVLLSARLSGTVQSAQLAASAVADVVPVTIVDSESVSYALGFQAIRAAELAAAGGSADEIAATITAERARYHIIFFVETLEHLRRGGRIGKAAQLVGTMLKLKPLLRVDGGQVVPFERTRTRSRAIATLLDFARELNGVEQAAVIYNSTPEEAASLAERVRQISTSDSIPVVQFGPVISTHVGPGVLGLVLKEQKRG